MTIDDLVIKPEFENLIPKLSKEENAQLEANILMDGKVREPIITWGNVIVDGHHRYHILKEHSEITDYKIEDGGFANEHDALAWACANQLGRRNLSITDIYYLRGQMYNERKLSVGAPTGNANAKLAKQSCENRNFESSKTMDEVAHDCHVSRNTIEHDDLYAKGINVAEEVIPGVKETIMHGKLKVPKYLVEKISQVTPDKQRKAVIAISDGEIQEAKTILNGAKDSLEKYGLQDSPDAPQYSVDDLIEEISASLDGFISGAKTSVESRRNILSEESMDYFTEKMGEIFNRKIRDFMEGFLNE